MTNALLAFWHGFLSGLKRFGGIITDTVNMILLSIAYFIGAGISSILAKMSGKELLNLRKPDARVKSYWAKKETKKDPDAIYNQY